MLSSMTMPSFILLTSMLSDWDAAIAPHIDTILEVINIFIGIMCLFVASRTLKDKTNKARIGTSLFWGVLGFIFVAGSYIPHIVSGALVCFLGILTLFKQVKIGSVKTTSEEEAAERSKRVGNKVFAPVLAIGLTSLIVATALPSTGKVVLGFGAVVSLILLLTLLKPSSQEFLDETDRMVQQVGTTGILPQVLAALGAVFTAAGVGDVIASIIGGVVPADNRLMGVTAYVLGMVIFTIIMGNAFAAFAVITAGIGVPFVLQAGADPVMAGALAMTAGFCGTLLTPMAGNFNALPVALLEMQDEYGVIKQQTFVALAMILVHIVLMYFLAF